MLKSVAWMAVVVGSVGAAVACGSKSNSGSNFPENDASNEEDGGGSSSSSGGGSSGSSSGGTSCNNPLSLLSLAGITPPSTCKPCLMSSCSTDYDACSTMSCTDCEGALLQCAMSSCKSDCFPTSEAGASSGGSSDASMSGNDGCVLGTECTMLSGCCTNLANSSNSTAMAFAASCTATVNQCSESTCMSFLNEMVGPVTISTLCAF
jgi:hypothetical protein